MSDTIHLRHNVSPENFNREKHLSFGDFSRANPIWDALCIACSALLCFTLLYSTLTATPILTDSSSKYRKERARFLVRHQSRISPSSLLRVPRSTFVPDYTEQTYLSAFHYSTKLRCWYKQLIEYDRISTTEHEKNGLKDFVQVATFVLSAKNQKTIDGVNVRCRIVLLLVEEV